MSVSKWISLLPTEVWDLVAEQLSDPPDLLHLALVHSRLRDVVIPTHLLYCRVLTDVLNEEFWSELTPGRAWRMRELRVASVPLAQFAKMSEEATFDRRTWVNRAIFNMPDMTYCRIRRATSFALDEDKLCFHDPDYGDEQDDVVPPLWVTPMSRCISLMTGLSKLVLHLSVCDVLRLAPGDFFSQLGPQVDDMEIRLFYCLYEPDPRVSQAIDSIVTLKGGYSRFAWDSGSFTVHSDIKIILEALVEFLNTKCASLDTLEIVVVPKDVSPQEMGHNVHEFWQGHWPNLKSLSLHGLRANVTSWSFATAFFERHSTNLRTLRLTGSGPSSTDAILPYVHSDGVYRNLRILETDNPCIVSQFFHYHDEYAARRIESLSMQVQGDVEDIIEAVDKICRHGKIVGSLRELTYKVDLKDDRWSEQHCSWLRLIGQCYPAITVLITRPKRICAYDFYWYKVVDFFPNLEVLKCEEGDYFRLWNYDEEEIEENFGNLLIHCPGLRQLDDWVKISDSEWKNRATGKILVPS